MAKSFPGAYLNDWHQHARIQLVYGVSGIMEVRTSNGLWVLSPLRALWVPHGVKHQMRTHGPVELRTLFIHPDCILPDMPQSASVIQVSPLLKELILRATDLPVEYDEMGPAGKVMDLILSELKWSGEGQLYMPVLQDERLQRIYASMCSDPSDARGLEAWADQLHISSKTLGRLVRKETGTSFSNWQQSVRIHLALPKLASGEHVTSVALDMGYSSPAGFTRMFKRVMGVTPSDYFIAP